VAALSCATAAAIWFLGKHTSNRAIMVASIGVREPTGVVFQDGPTVHEHVEI
jgi:hypothetical protein